MAPRSLVGVSGLCSSLRATRLLPSPRTKASDHAKGDRESFDPYAFEAIDWDDEEDPEGNLAHCLRHGVDEQVVAEVLRVHPVEVRIRLETAEFAIVGPDELRERLWTILFDTSSRRGDWLRPVTGWQSKAREERLWQQITGKDWRTP